MRFNTHSHLAGLHATLSASQNAWTNYDSDKLEAVYRAKLAAQHGSDLHEFAAQAIRLNQRLEETSQTVNMYVNDAIGFRMVPEQVLFYSVDAFGTADAISFRDDFLRIHDLKTGLTEAGVRQLEVYAAFFCLEYGYNPFKLAGMEFRIYQSDEIKIFEGDPHTITQLMETTKMFSANIARLRAEVE